MALVDLSPEELSGIAHTNDASLVDVPAPNNTIYHEPSDRVLSVPQGLNAHETQYTIDKEIDGKQDFFAQTPVTPEQAMYQIQQAIGRSIAKSVVSIPSKIAGLGIEQADLAKADTQNGKLNESIGAGVFGLPRVIRDAAVLYYGADEMNAKLTAVQERNKAFMDRHGLNDVAGNPVARFMGDLGGVGASLAGTIGGSMITRSTKLPLLIQSAFVKSDAYKDAKDKGFSAEDASAYSDQQFGWNLATESIGTGYLFAAMAENTAFKAAKKAILSEGTQEASQQYGQDSLSNYWGITNLDGKQKLENAAYAGLLGGITGGAAGAGGHALQLQAEDAGLDEGKAKDFVAAVEKHTPLAKQDILEFLDKEVAPIANQDDHAATFMQLMQKFHNDPSTVDESQFTPAEKQVFDHFVQIFNSSVSNPQSQQAVEKSFYDKAIAAGVEQDQAVAASKLIGARADAAARALEITPMEWYQRHNLDVEVQRTPDEAMKSYEEKLAALKESDTAAPTAQETAPATTETPPVPTPEMDQRTDVAVKPAEQQAHEPPPEGATQAQLDEYQNRLNDLNTNTKESGVKKPIIQYLKSLGGVRYDTPLGAELRHIGINHKTAIGLFRKDEHALHDIDQIPANEFAQVFGFMPPHDGTYGEYVDRDWLLEALRDEQFGKKLGEMKPQHDESFIQALDKAGLDYRTATPQQVFDALGTDGDITSAAYEMDVKLTPKAVRQIRGIMQDNPQLDVRDAIDDWVMRDEYQPETMAGIQEDADLAAFGETLKQLDEMQKPEPAFAPETPPAPIEDFGEKIAGARKDTYTKYRAAMQEDLPSDYREVTLSKYFPQPDYDAMIAAGTDVKVLAAVKAMREEIPAKPRQPHLLQRWGDTLKLMRQFSNDLIDGNYDTDHALGKVGSRSGVATVAKRIEMYDKLGYPAFKSAEGWDITEHYAQEYKGKELPAGSKVAYVRKNGRLVEVSPDYETALNYVKDALATAPEKSGRSTKLDIYQVTKTGEIKIGKKVGTGKFIDLKGGFTNVRDARNFLKENETALLEQLARKKDTKPERRSTNDPRKGTDYRMGENTSPEKFASEFGFRGVQFGNYVEQGKRGKDLNNAYDALLDLANLLGVPPQALSLNGSLGLAFGARGKGGKGAAAAHYEPTQVVINLTKKDGAGSLGHEWFHALDNFLGKMVAKPDSFITKNTFTTSDNVRPEVVAAFKNLAEAINSSPFVKRSIELDSRKVEDYWSTQEEMAARAFEMYLIEKAKKQGLSNDYLANILPEEGYDVLSKMAGEDEPNPYPTRAENEKLAPAFDKLFNTLKTKKTDKGVTFYQAIDKTKAGDQIVLAGAERISDKQLAERKMQESMRSSKEQQGMDFGLFGDEHKQGSLFQNQETEGAARGSITFGNDKTVINLFKDANPSTLFHELGHLFLRDMQAIAAESRRPMVRNDFDIIKKWLGSKSNQFTEAQEEKFARGFEAYLREGKAPKPELQSVFDRFKAWLTSIYKSVKDLNVELSPEVRNVFDRMLGGDFSRTQQQIDERQNEQRMRDYEQVAVAVPKSTFWSDTIANFRDSANLTADAFVPVSTRLGNIDVRLKHAVRKFIFRTGLTTNHDQAVVKGFIEKVSDGFSEGDYRVLDLALKNRDTAMVEKLVKQYGIEKEWAAVRSTLDEIYNDAKDVGLDLSYVEDYFPRHVKPETALDYMAYLRGQPVWSELKLALEEKDPNGEFTPEERAEFANNYLRGFTSNTLKLQKPSFAETRSVDYVTPEANRFYDDSMQTLIRYISGLRHGIEARKLFGKSEKSTDKNIGSYVLQLIDEGVIDPKQEKELRQILKAVVEPTGTRGVVGWAKNASYIYLMGSPISAITQIQDLAFSLAFNGYYRTGRSLVRSLTGNQLLKKEDLGIEHILEEYSSNSRASRAVRATFKAVGLTAFDNVGKEVYIDAAYSRLQAANKKGGKAWDEQVQNIFGVEADQFKQDLANNVMSENVKYMLFSELSDVQPISLAEMPRGYLRGGNGRIFYMVKTYTIKQIDIYRRSVYSEIVSGDPKRMITGTRNLIHLTTALMLLGMGSDALKDLILGRKIDVNYLMTDNLLKLAGFSKYQIYKSRHAGLLNTFWQTLFVPSVGAPFDDLAKDIRDIGINGKKKFKDAELFQRIPFVGKFYYWWWGGGHTKEEKKAHKPA